MKIMFRCLLIAGALLIGCSKYEDNNSSPGGPQPPKPPKPPVIVLPTDGSVELTSQTAIFEVTQSLGARKELNGNFYLAQSNTPRAKQLVKEKMDLIRGKVSAENCIIDIKHPADDIDPTDGAAVLFPRMKVRVEGPNCPMEVSLDMFVVSDTHDPHEICEETSVAKICKFIAKVKMNYKVLEPKFSEKLRLKNGEMNMIFKVEQTFFRTSWASEETPNMVMKGTTNFDFNSADGLDKAHTVAGTQEFDVKMSLPTVGDPDRPGQMISAVKETLQYVNENTNKTSSFMASMNVNGSSSTELYMIDGAVVKADKYAAEKEKFTNSMISFGKKEGVRNEPPNPIPKFGRL